jgi:alkanesulfonate monooxygenase SsuD/methylene tetrahydromethanopterin reductase-like flavin-dependent oxidoreductase (luciferase family)
MPEIGYALSSEDHPPNDLVRFAREAEEAGFEFALVSDHFHPWVDAQGESPFVWSVIGAIAHATERLRLGTGSLRRSSACTRPSSRTPRRRPPR